MGESHAPTHAGAQTTLACLYPLCTGTVGLRSRVAGQSRQKCGPQAPSARGQCGDSGNV